MTRKGVALTVLTVFAMSASFAQTPPRATIWALAANSGQPSIVQIDPQTFNVLRTAAVPAVAIDHPEYLAVNGKGQLLYALPNGMELANAVETAGNVWFSSGESPRSFPRQQNDRRSNDWYLNANGDGLYVLEARQAKTFDANGNDATIVTSTRLLRATSDGTSLTPVVALPSLPLCKCATGVCSETCPQWQVWAPDNSIGDFFLATRFVEGQLQTDFEETLLYRRAGGWRATKLKDTIESPLDASQNGEVIVTAVVDAGCCGWVNESSDQLALFRNGQSTVLFDEFRRYDNRNYDVTFSASNAKLSPTGDLVAYTIAASQSAADEVRLSSTGKDSVPELARVKQTIASLPIVEIVTAATASRLITTIPRAELAGWLSENEVLVVQAGKLAAYDVRAMKMRQSSIVVSSVTKVFVR